MPREFVPFDEEEIDAELDALKKSSAVDAAKLDFCMARVEQVGPGENPGPAIMWTFKEGFKELRHENGRYKGRPLFYEPPVGLSGLEELVILRVFRKQTQKTPKSEISKALSRMKADLDWRNKGGKSL